MSISGLLEELNIEIQSLMVINMNQEKLDTNDSLRFTLNKMKILASALKTRYFEIERRLGFFDKMKLKSSVQDLLKVIKNGKIDIDYKIFEADLMLSKICAKYRVSPTIEKRKFDVDKELRAKQEEFNPGFSERISKAFDSARNNRKIRGIVVDEPATTLNVGEINEAAVRTKKIETLKLKREQVERETAKSKLKNGTRVDSVKNQLYAVRRDGQAARGRKRDRRFSRQRLL